MPLRLNRNQLLDLIESIEAGGGGATELRRELEALGPDQDSRTRTRRRGARVNSEEELTTAEHLSDRVSDLFPDGLSDDLLARLVDLDRNHSLKELKAMCVEAGLSAGGDKKELAVLSRAQFTDASHNLHGPSIAHPGTSPFSFILAPF